MSRKPLNFDWPYGEPGRMRLGMQGQSFVTVLDNNNLRGTRISKLIIVMGVRKVSNVHIHDATDVFVDVLECGGQGVLTLAGHELECAVWTNRYQTLWLPPGVPHVAIYPEHVDGVPSPDLVAMETRTSSSADADIRDVSGYGELLTARLEMLALADRVDPSPQMLHDPTPGSSCFPGDPTVR